MVRHPSTPGNRYHVAFPIPEELRDEALELVTCIREAEDKTRYADDLTDLVDRIARHGLGYFFIRPIELAGLGPVTRKTVSVALNSGRRAVLAVARRVVRGLSDEEMATMADFVEGIVYEFDEAG